MSKRARGDYLVPFGGNQLVRRKSTVRRSTRRSFYKKSLRNHMTPSGIHSFMATYADFDVGFFSGQSGGMQLYGSGSVPGSGVPLAPVPAAAGTYAMTWNFSLAQMNGVIFDTGGVARTTSSIALTNFAEYANLFDEYILDKISMDIYFNCNSSSMGTTGGHVSFPCLGVALDYDDSNFTAINSMQQYSNYRIMQLGQQGRLNNGKQSIVLKPKFSAVVQTLAGTAIGMPYRGWLDSLQPTAEHFGIKMFYLNTEVGTPGAPSFIGTAQVSTKLYFRMRGTK